jgi:hypothetical protein
MSVWKVVPTTGGADETEKWAKMVRAVARAAWAQQSNRNEGQLQAASHHAIARRAFFEVYERVGKWLRVARYSAGRQFRDVFRDRSHVVN